MEKDEIILISSSLVDSLLDAVQVIDPGNKNKEGRVMLILSVALIIMCIESGKSEEECLDKMSEDWQVLRNIFNESKEKDNGTFKNT